MTLTYDTKDVAKEKLKKSLAIDLVGIKDLKIPIKIDSQFTIPAQVSVFVSLDDPHVRGIHMSRMYLAIHKHFSKKTFKISDLKKLLEKIMQDQKGLSHSSRVEISMELPIERKALKSSTSGWRVYPFFVSANYSHKKKQYDFIVGTTVTYSSTCPCSASLSRDLIKKEFEKNFSKKKTFSKKEMLEWFENKKSLAATPHAQKSTAQFKLKIQPRSLNQSSIWKYISDVEKVLGTPVQTAVKREDEAEFAKLNANHLMFCEDAARKVGFYFKNKKEVLDYKIKIQHYESLHPFTVESSIVKGLKQGWRV